MKAVYFSILKIVYVFVILISIYSIVFLLAKLAIQIKLVQTVTESSLIMKSAKNYTQQINKINNELDDIIKIKNNFIKWSYLLEHLSKNINSDIKLSSLSISKENNSIIVSGNAKNRDSLLELKNFFEESEYFSEIDLPTKSLLEKENINFQITAKVQSYDFKKLE